MGNAIAVVGRINDILARHTPVDAASLAGPAGDYQNLRKEAARRLSKFSALHSAGQEPQAVELAETTPALPGLLRVLDFDGQHEWNALLEKHGLPPLVPFTPKQLQSLAEIEKCALGCDYYSVHAAPFLADEPIYTDAGKSYVAYPPLGVVLCIDG